MTDTVRACPECDNSSIVINATGKIREGRERYRCSQCNTTFDEAVERPTRAPWHGLSGLPRRLAEIGEREDDS